MPWSALVTFIVESVISHLNFPAREEKEKIAISGLHQSQKIASFTELKKGINICTCPDSRKRSWILAIVAMHAPTNAAVFLSVYCAIH